MDHGHGGRDGPTMNHCPLERLENEEQYEAVRGSMLPLVPDGDDIVCKTAGGIRLGCLAAKTAAIVKANIARLGLTVMNAQFNVGAHGPYVTVDVASYAARRGKPGYP